MKESLSNFEKVQRYLLLSKKRHDEGHLSFGRQLSEMLILLALRGIGPGYYHLSGFWRTSIPWRDKWRHLNGRRYLQFVRKINPPQYHKLSQNKLAEKGILMLLGFPTPKCLGLLCRVSGRTSTGLPLRTLNDLRRLLAETNTGKVCFKPVEGWAGKGFCAAEIRREGSDLMLCDLQNSRIVSVEDFCRDTLDFGEGRQYILENYLDQHPILSSFNPSSVNTLRLWVVSHPEPEASVVVGYLRVGRAGSLVDNQSSGGIVAPVDLEKGTLRPAIDGLPQREEYPVHPDHGAPIAGMTIPFLEEAKQLAVTAMQVFPKMRFAGIDIAIGKSGPIILELNVSPDMQGAAFADVPARSVLPIS
jgi:hypothetical protein